MKKRATKIPYENYGLPASAELGGAFIDFNEVLEKRPVIKKIKRRRNDQKRSERSHRLS